MDFEAEFYRMLSKMERGPREIGAFEFARILEEGTKGTANFRGEAFTFSRGNSDTGGFGYQAK